MDAATPLIINSLLLLDVTWIQVKTITCVFWFSSNTTCASLFRPGLDQVLDSIRYQALRINLDLFLTCGPSCWWGQTPAAGTLWHTGRQAQCRSGLKETERMTGSPTSPLPEPVAKREKQDWWTDQRLQGSSTTLWYFQVVSLVKSDNSQRSDRLEPSPSLSSSPQTAPP